MKTQARSFPSAFYSVVDGASEVALEFPVDGESGGPFWNEDGGLDLGRCKDWDQEELGIVSLGGNRYRLAERLLGPFSRLRLYWGDEFTAHDGQDGALRLVSVCMPRPYAHFRFLTSGGFSNEHQLAQYLHTCGGGWETVAGGMLTLSIPAEHANELQRLMYDQGLAPRGFTLEA